MTDAATPLVDVAQPAETPPSGEQTERSSRWAAWVFGAYVAAGLPLLVLGLGKFWWFFRDDWFFITDRDISYHGLIDDHNGHWSTVPVVAFRFLWSIFGLHTYAPYKASVVALHLVVVVCVRAVMRRYGVGPWLATVLAGVLVLFGAGREDILWAFQIGFTGSIALMYVQWVIADRDQAPIDRRDLLGVVCGILAVASSSPSIPIVAALSVTLLIRRGWRASVLHAAPPTAAYLLWSLLASPDRSSPWGSPPVSALFEWVENGLVSTVDDLLRARVDGSSADGVWAVGDVNGGPQQTYVSYDDNRIVLSQLDGAGGRSRADRVAVPTTVFMTPPLGRVGLSETEAVEQGRRVTVCAKEVAKIAVMPRPKTLGETHGLIKLVVDADTDLVLGAALHTVDAQELVNLVALAMRTGTTRRQLLDGIWTHPSTTEALNEVLALPRG